MLKFVKDKTSFISGICLIFLSLLLFYEASTLSPFGSVFPYAITTALLIFPISPLTSTWPTNLLIPSTTAMQRTLNYQLTSTHRRSYLPLNPLPNRKPSTLLKQLPPSMRLPKPNRSTGHKSSLKSTEKCALLYVTPVANGPA